MATVAALVWLFGQQAGVDGVGVLLAACCSWPSGPGSTAGRAARLGVGSCARHGAGPDGGGSGRGAGACARAGPASRAWTPARGRRRTRWQEYSASRARRAPRPGTPVFLDFTAAWCLTCQVNERVALAHAKRRASASGARGSWPCAPTGPAATSHITQALARYGRQGVPVYVLYGREPGPATAAAGAADARTRALRDRRVAGRAHHRRRIVTLVRRSS